MLEPPKWERFLLLSIPVLTGLALVSCLGYAGLWAVQILVDPNDAIYRLARPLTPTENAQGMVRGVGKWVRQGDADSAREVDGDPLCQIIHERHCGKNDWCEKHRWTLTQPAQLHLADGRQRSMGPRFIRGEGLAVQPEAFTELRKKTAVRLKRVIGALPNEGRLREQCTPFGQTIFVEGCLSNSQLSGELGGCGDQPLLIAVGENTPQEVVDARAAQLAMGGAAGALLILIVIGGAGFTWLGSPRLISLLQFHRPSTPKTQPRHVTPEGSNWKERVVLWLLGVIPLYWCGSCTVESAAPLGSSLSLTPLAYTIPLIVISASGILLLSLRERRADLVPIPGWVRTDWTPGLPFEPGCVVEIFRRVAPSAPEVIRPLASLPCSFYHIHAERRGLPGNWVFRQECVLRSSDFLQLEAPNGGMESLDIVGAAVALRSMRKFVAAANQTHQANHIRRIIAYLPRESFPLHVRLKESWLDAGEPVWILAVLGAPGFCPKTIARRPPGTLAHAGIQPLALARHSLVAEARGHLAYLEYLEKAVITIAVITAFYSMWLLQK